ncbi:MAG: hypothetical protein Q9218_004623 [Villophora microphyllina]
MTTTIVDSPSLLLVFLDSLLNLSTTPPSLYCDLEGIRLSRNGSISILQIYVRPQNHTFLIDINSLGAKAFITPNEAGLTLKSILESGAIPKVFFDVRNDADALYAHFGIRLHRVHDVQLLEVAARRQSSRAIVLGLAACIERDSRLGEKARQDWQATKRRGRELFAPECGGSYEIFNKRPLCQDLVDYCTQDVVCLPILYDLYSEGLSSAWTEKLRKETEKRIAKVQSVSYDPHSTKKIVSPWAWMDAKPGGWDIDSKSATYTKKKASTSPGMKVAINLKNNNTLNSMTTPTAGTIQKVAADSQASSVTAPKSLAHPLLSGQDLPTSTSTPPSSTRTSIPTFTNSSKPKFAFAPPHPPPSTTTWTCATCDRTMQTDQKDCHLRGRPHRSRENRHTTTQGVATCVTEMDGEAAKPSIGPIACEENRRDNTKRVMVGNSAGRNKSMVIAMREIFRDNQPKR